MITSQVEFKIDTDGQALMRIKASGVVALYFAHKPKLTTSPTTFLYDGSNRKYAVGTVYYYGDEPKVAAWPVTSVRFHEEKYPMRGTETRPSDWVHSYERWISGRLYSLTRFKDGVSGTVTVKLFKGKTTTLLKQFVYTPKENA